MFIYEPSVPSLARVLTHQGKVRDTYHLPGYDHLLLIVATDRVSTHNIVHVSTIAGKGIILTRMSVFWMNRLAPIRTHLVASGNDIYTYLPAGLEYPADLHERALVVKRLDMIPVEFILRSRAAGSWFKDYKGANVDPYQLKIRDGLELMSLFYQDGFPIFTPTDKSEDDLPLVSRDVELQYSEAYKIGLAVYMPGRLHALQKDIEIIDGKFEIGRDPETGEYVLADECLTPDSCRFVRSSDVQVGKEPPWMDKQFLRLEAERMWAGGEKYPLTFRPETIERTSQIYAEIADIIMN